MPVHALAGHLVVITTPIAALLALVYAWRPAARRALRLPVVAASTVNTVLAVWAEEAGSALYDRLRGSAHATGRDLPPSVLDHAHQGDVLTVSSFALLVTVLVVAWWVLAPGRDRGTGAVVASCTLTAGALSAGWFLGTTLVEAIHSVWAHHTLWP